VALAEAQVAQSAEELDGKLDGKLEALDGTRGELDIANKQIELSRIAIDDLWGSLGQMASRIVGIESLADEKLAAISSARSTATPQNKQKAMQWVDKFRRRAAGGGELLANNNNNNDDKD
jgi:uncharacterized coiled-coil DUF342 family protein